MDQESKDKEKKKKQGFSWMVMGHADQSSVHYSRPLSSGRAWVQVSVGSGVKARSLLMPIRSQIFPSIFIQTSRKQPRWSGGGGPSTQEGRLRQIDSGGSILFVLAHSDSHEDMVERHSSHSGGSR